MLSELLISPNFGVHIIRTSLTLKPNRKLLGLLAAGFLGAGFRRIALLGAASLRRVAFLGAAGSSFGRGGSLGGGIVSGLLVRIATAAYHSDGSHDDNKRENLFHSAKCLEISCSVTPQR